MSTLAGTGQPLKLPYVDLHLYTDDGRHVGMNYAIGQFENQNLIADASGNQINGQEWIVTPVSTPGSHFIVSDLPAVQFLQTYPSLQSALGTSDTVEIVGVGAPAGGAPVYTSPTTVNMVTGSFLEVPVSVLQNPDGSINLILGQATVTIDSLISELDSYNGIGAIKTTDPYQGLRDKLVSAKNSIKQGMNNTARNQLHAYQNQLSADNLVTPYARTAMLDDSQSLIDSISR